MTFLLSLSSGPQQNKVFSTSTTEKEVFAASVASEIKASDMESLCPLLGRRTKILEIG